MREVPICQVVRTEQKRNEHHVRYVPKRTIRKTETSPHKEEGGKNIESPQRSRRSSAHSRLASDGPKIHQYPCDIRVYQAVKDVGASYDALVDLFKPHLP